MSRGGGKSIGSLETYEPEDKSFSKHVFKEGVGDTTPNEGSQCTVHLALIGRLDIFFTTNLVSQL